LTIVDLKRTETITNSWIQSKSQWTPYDGVKIQGWPVGTVVRGAMAMWQGQLAASATGAPIRFHEAQ
ncbi:MAG: dihydroorotase, partial [Hyphomicrobiaceae bacterium]